jgi:RNA polymerase sigma factor (sigma-70 family)
LQILTIESGSSVIVNYWFSSIKPRSDFGELSRVVIAVFRHHQRWRLYVIREKSSKTIPFGALSHMDESLGGGARMTPHPQWVRSAMDRYERPLVLYAQKLLGDSDRARDVVQETFLRLCRQSPAGLNGSLTPWLYTVCRSRAMDVRRKEKRMRLVDESTILEMPTQGSDPASDAEHADDLSQATRLMAALPGNQQEVLRLKFQHGLSYREIAQVTKLSESNVGFLIHSGLKTIREKMKAREK